MRKNAPILASPKSCEQVRQPAGAKRGSYSKIKIKAVLIMNVNDYGKYNFTDMLISIEEEMENHITALKIAGKQIGLLWNDCDRMADRICYLESILDMHNIDYIRDDFLSCRPHQKVWRSHKKVWIPEVLHEVFHMRY